MTPSELRNEVQRLVGRLQQAGLALTSFSPTQKTLGGNRVRVSSPTESPGSLDRRLLATIEEYLDFIRRGNYTSVLADGSLLQISYVFRYGDVSQHRLCYYPCPLDLAGLDDVDLETINVGILESLEWEAARLLGEQQEMSEDEEDSIVARGERGHRLWWRTPLRFDFDARRPQDDHPRVHLHMGHRDCRVPVFAPLSIGHFVQFVFRQFYHEWWLEYEFLRTWPKERLDRTIETNEAERLHVNHR